MARRTPALVAVIALTALAALTATNADAGEGHHPSVRLDGRGAHLARSVALFGDRAGDFRAAKGLTGPRPHNTALLDVEGAALASAINPVRGKDGLLCGGGHRVFPVHGLRSSPKLSGSGIDASAYAGEGGAGFQFQCYGVAVHGSFGLATGDSQGLLQLIRRKGSWRIDKRVRSPGTNDAGRRHVPGWIDVRDSTTNASLFESVAIAPRPLRDGSFLAVAVDRADRALVVVRGVGTAEPRVVGALSNPALGNEVAGFGNGGIAFLPSSRSRAVIVTRTGFALLSLRHPSAPRLRMRTTVGDGSTEPGSITVSADGDHLAVAVGSRVHGYRHLLAAVRHGRQVKKQTSFRLNTSARELVSDVAYTSDGTLVVLHGDTSFPRDWLLTLVRKVPLGHHAIRGSLRTTRPSESGSLSVWPEG